jgi:hypothetical protein
VLELVSDYVTMLSIFDDQNKCDCFIQWLGPISLHYSVISVSVIALFSG